LKTSVSIEQIPLKKLIYFCFTDYREKRYLQQ